MKVGAVNADEYKELGGKYGVRGFPTIKIFGADKQKPESYEGPRTADGLTNAAVKAIKNKISSNLGGKSSGSGGSKVI